MSPVEIERILRVRLAARVAEDRVAIEALASAIERLVAPAVDERGEWMRAPALAFEVERCARPALPWSGYGPRS